MLEAGARSNRCVPFASYSCNTHVYASIADRTVANEYSAVS